MINWLRRALTVASMAVAVVGAQGVAHAQAPAAPTAVANATTAEYRLGVADKVRVTVFGEDKLSGEFQVGANGVVALPLIGDTAALGLTPAEFQRAVTTALAEGYLKEPKVSVEVLTYRPYYILGEVKKPGEYPYTNGLTVLNAVATAEGFTYRADTKKVWIKRANAMTEQSVQLNGAVSVAPGDTVRIGERYF